MAQLSFKWPVQASYAPEDFIISAANEEAVQFLETWPDGKSYAALISGPEACGKTHLLRNWAARTHAIIIDARTLGVLSSTQIFGNATHAVLEDIHAGIDEVALFHLLRHAESHGSYLLFSACLPVRQLGFSLADLRSRLLALPAAAIGAPDEELLAGFLLKGFADRQLRVNREVIEFTLKRMERSFLAAQALVERLEERAVQSGRLITVPLVKSII